MVGRAVDNGKAELFATLPEISDWPGCLLDREYQKTKASKGMQTDTTITSRVRIRYYSTSFADLHLTVQDLKIVCSLISVGSAVTANAYPARCDLEGRRIQGPNAFPGQPYAVANLPSHTTFDLSLAKEFGVQFSASLTLYLQSLPNCTRNSTPS